MRHQELRSVIERLWNSKSCKVIQCGKCSGAFAHPFVGGDATFYETANANQRSGSAYPSDRWEYGQSLKIAGRMDSVLEIGAGDGAFISHLKDVPNITALEYSSYGMEVIQQRYPAVNVLPGDCFPKLSNESFSHIFLFQVLEHIGQLDAFIQNLHRLLKPGGLAFISVPNPNRVEFCELNGLTLDMPPNHISRFTKHAIESLASRHGLSLETLIDEPFSWKQAVAEFLRFRFMRLAQQQGSIPARINRMNGMRKNLSRLYVSTILPSAVVRIALGSQAGASRLFVLHKI